jgi:pimeloyl-ACP methyl ester carboxylesterase
LQETLSPWIADDTFRADVAYLENLWQRTPIGPFDLPLIDLGQGEPLVFVPILEHLEFVYTRQIRALSEQQRVILYRRHETRTHTTDMAARVAELLNVLDTLHLAQCDLIAHGDAAMVLLHFAIQHPERCRSLIIVAQGADYRISPHPFIWFLHELYLRLPIEDLLPASFLRRNVIKYIIAHRKQNKTVPALPFHLIEEQFAKINDWPLVYKFSVLPIIHNFDIRKQLQGLTMPVLLINRADDALSPEHKTHWLAMHLPNCISYQVVKGKERFFMYSQAAQITPLLARFLKERTLSSSQNPQSDQDQDYQNTEIQRSLQGE